MRKPCPNNDGEIVNDFQSGFDSEAKYFISFISLPTLVIYKYLFSSLVNSFLTVFEEHLISSYSLIILARDLFN